MKLNYRIVLLALFAVAIFFPAQKARSQDTLTVNWAMPDGVTPKKNALRDAIKGDTTATGARANLNRVYKLTKGGFYWNMDRIENPNFTLRLVGEPAGATFLGNPPVVQMVARANGSVDGRLITGQSSVTLKNLWLTGRDDNGVQTYYQPIQMDAKNATFIIDNCVLEQTNFALIAFTGSGNKIIYTNNKFRNLIGQPSTQQWEGRGISIWADQDTVIVENNTFFNVGMTAFQLESGSAKYLRFNHNTMVNIGRNFITGNWFREAYFANNLIVNGFWHGEGRIDYSSASRDPRAYYSGMFSIGPLPGKYGPPEGRRILLAKTAAWRDPFFATKYADTIRTQYFVGPVTKADFFAKLDDQGNKAYPQMVAMDTSWLGARPNFPIYPSAGLLDSMWTNITNLRAGTTPARPYFFNPSKFATDVAWPLPENFSYTTPANLLTAGSDGLPLGDLNWFPTQKATFEANKTALVAGMQGLAGNVIRYDPIADYEAEAGTLTGTAVPDTFKGFSYFQMDGGGFIEWTFNLAAAGKLDLNIWQHMRGNSMRGQHTFINGTEIHDKAHGWGELIYDKDLGVTKGMPTNAWAWVRWVQDSLIEANALNFLAGQNKIKISSSWGYQNFAGVDLLTPGTTTVVKSLRAPEAAYDIVAPRGEGAPFVPSRFVSVALGSNGSITWSMNAAVAGNYKLQIYFNNPGSTAETGQLQADGGTAINIKFAAKADSTGDGVLSGAFALTAGAHSVKLTGSNIKVDVVQLNKETVILGVPKDVELPYNYALEQNYPNPFNPSTTINFSLAKASNVKLIVYNVLGQKIATLVDNHMNAGPQSVVFDASRLASGVYFYRLEAGSFVKAVKMMLIK